MTGKTIIDADYGRGIDLLRGAEGTDQLVHSKGVRLDLPGFTWIMLSGVVALDDDLQVVGAGDIHTQTRFVLQEIRGDLAGQGASIDDICRVRVYVVGLTPERFRAIHEERARFFRSEHYPASTLVEVAGLIKPELLIEIDADAVILGGDAA
ncbi:MAG TPA: RidA family protein [Actinomycetota bacterium]|nr:RidA family protein [Actinomycetota bacterium]